MHQPALTVEAADEAATIAIGRALAAALPAAGGLLLGLAGELGAGKTTLARALLRELGVTGPVRSPTYTLVEPYEIDGKVILHFDLYRLEHPQDLETLGYRELRAGSRLALLEWPERAGERLGPVDLTCRIGYANGGRRLDFDPGTAAGEDWLRGLGAAASGMAVSTSLGM